MQVEQKRWRVGALVVLLMLALGVRLFKAGQLPLVMPDTIRYIQQAQMLAVDPIQAVRAEVYHPLFSLVILGVHAAGEAVGKASGMEGERMGWIYAAQGIGIVCGALMAVLIYALARRLGARFWPALAAGVAWIVGRRTSLYGAEGLSDMLALCLFTGAMLLAMDAMRPGGRGSWWRFAWSGLLSGLSYLTRPEGLAAPLIICGTLMIWWGVRSVARRGQGLRFKLVPRSMPGRAVLGGAAIMLAAAALPAVPYALAIGGLTHKKHLLGGEESVAAMTGANVPGFNGMTALGSTGVRPNIAVAGESEVEAAGSRNAVLWVWEEVCRTYGYVPMAVLLLPILWQRRFWGRARLRLLVLIWTGVWYGMMFWLLKSAHYLNGRHTLVLEVLGFAMLGVALPLWRRPMQAWMEFWKKRSPDWPAWAYWRGWPGVLEGAVFAVICAVSVAQLGLPPWPDGIPMGRAAAWARDNVREDVMICDREQLVGYYALHPYGLCGASESGEPRMAEIASLKAAHMDAAGREPTIMVGWLFEWGKPVYLTVGSYRAVAAFRGSGNRVDREAVYVLYALPGDKALKDGRAEVFLERMGE